MESEYKSALLTFIKFNLEQMTAQERIDFIDGVIGDYCPYCGYDDGGRDCQCQNDD